MARRPDNHELSDTYRAYLVRMWRDTPHAAWRVSAQSAETGEVIRFADLKALYSFLNSQASDSLAIDTSISDETESQT